MKPATLRRGAHLWLIPALGLTSLLLATAPARAHDAGEARLEVSRSGPTLAVELSLARVDALDLLGIEKADAPADDALFPAVQRALPEWLNIEPAGACSWSTVEVSASGLRGLTISARSDCSAATGLDWRAARHPRLALRAVGTLSIDGHSTGFTLGRLDGPLRLGEAPGLGAFVLSGIEHILIGWDHLAFLLAILLGCSTLRRVVAVVTAFTVAHSITLALGATQTLVLPSGPVEAVIAASIAAAAGLGLYRWRRGTLDHPGRDAPVGGPGAAVAVCFAFGLVHGLGFAGLLAEMLPRDGALLGPLVAFNVGVEAGQIAVVAVAFPLLAALGRHAKGRPALPLLLAALLALGVFVGVMRITG